MKSELRNKIFDALDKINSKRSGANWIDVRFNEDTLSLYWGNRSPVSLPYYDFNHIGDNYYDYLVAKLNPGIAYIIKYWDYDDFIADNMINPFIEIEKKES